VIVSNKGDKLYTKDDFSENYADYLDVSPILIDSIERIFTAYSYQSKVYFKLSNTNGSDFVAY